MTQTTVFTKSELARALEQGNTATVKGSLATEIRQRYETRKKVKTGATIASVAMIVAGIAAIPFTAGASVGGMLAGFTALGGAVSISAAELAIITGGLIAAYGIAKGARVKLNNDGSVTVEPDK